MLITKLNYKNISKTLDKYKLLCYNNTCKKDNKRGQVYNLLIIITPIRNIYFLSTIGK